MKKPVVKVYSYELPMSAKEFMESFNKNMPLGYPRASLAILEKFKQAHASLFKSNGSWSLDQHRKRMIEWLPQNLF